MRLEGEVGHTHTHTHTHMHTHMHTHTHTHTTSTASVGLLLEKKTMPMCAAFLGNIYLTQYTSLTI